MRKRFKLKLSKKQFVAGIAALAVLVGTIIAVPTFTSRAEEFDDTNPDLEFVSIQGDPEQYKETPAYDHVSTFEQKDGKYTIDTNSYVAWFPQDDVAFAYKYYGVKTNNEDTIEASVKANYFTDTNGGTFDLTKGAHHPSTGLMFRSGLDNDASFIYVHVRDQGQVVVVYRDPEYSQNLYGCTNQNGKNFSAGDYPLEFKMILTGTVVQVMYKGASDANWTRFSPVRMSGFGRGVYAGLCAHSGAEAQTMRATFSDLKMSGLASMNAEEGTPEGPTVKPVEPADPDIPLGDLADSANILLRETFTDNELANTPKGKENPIWSTFSTRPDISIKTVNENRMLFGEYAAAADYIGDEAWTDYSAEMDVMFTEDNAETAKSAVGLIVRHISNIYFGHQNYIVTVEKGHKICIYKNFTKPNMKLQDNAIMASVDLREVLGDDSYSVIGDGIMHHLKVECMDNKLTVFFDDKEVLAWTDDGTIKDSNSQEIIRVLGKGQVGIIFGDSYAYVDNIIVRKLTDEVGGDYDNYIGGNWDSPIPDYIQKQGEK